MESKKQKNSQTKSNLQKKAPECNEDKDGAVDIRSHGSNIHVISIIGQIEGHYFLGEGQKATKYEHIIPELVSAQEDDNIDGADHFLG